MAKKRPKIGIVLGGGAAKGLSHIGVLKELDKNNIPIDAIAGDSMGGFVAIMYAATLDPEKVEEFAKKNVFPHLLKNVDFSFSKDGIIKGNKLEKQINKFLGFDDFKNLKIPCSVNATNIIDGNEVIIRSGSLIKAIRATTAIPWVFQPVKKEKKVLVDGGLVNPLPISLLKNKVDIIIAVNVLGNEDKIKKKVNYASIMSQSYIVVQNSIIKAHLKINTPDVLIEPDMTDVDIFDFFKLDTKIKRGESATSKKIRKIKSLIEDKSK